MVEREPAMFQLDRFIHSLLVITGRRWAIHLLLLLLAILHHPELSKFHKLLSWNQHELSPAPTDGRILRLLRGV
jgi:hypothetical protein